MQPSQSALAFKQDSPVGRTGADSYTTMIPTARRRVCLLQDPLYRKNVAHQTMGYFYPPQLSYHFR